MEILTSFRGQFGEISRHCQGPCLQLPEQGARLEAGYFIFGTAERVCWLKADLMSQTGTWFEAFRWPSADPAAVDQIALHWSPSEERFLNGGLSTRREGQSAPSTLTFEDWIRSRLERILKAQLEFDRFGWAYDEAEAESVLERVRPALEAFLASELLKGVLPVLVRLGIPKDAFLRIRHDHPEAQSYEFLSFFDALQSEKRLLARAAAHGGRWSETFGEFLAEIENGTRESGMRRPEEFDVWWRDSGVNAALIAAAPEIPDEVLKRALRDYPI